MFKSAWDNNLAAPGHLLYTIVAAKGLGIDKPTELFVRIAILPFSCFVVLLKGIFITSTVKLTS